MVLGRFLFTHFWCRLPIKVAKVAGTTGRTRGFQTERSFSMMHDFRQSSEALRLSQVSKMLLQLSGQISAHCSSSEIRNTHLCLFRSDRDRNEKFGRKPSAINDSDRGAIAPIAPRSLQSRRELRPKTLSDRQQRSLSDHCHLAAKFGQKR